MDGLSQIIITSGFSLGASVVSAMLAVRLSLRQFRSQRWWEKKAETYSQIIEHLSHMEFSLGEWLEEFEGVSRLGDEYKKRLSETSTLSRGAVLRAASAGAYIISDDAATALETLRREFVEGYEDGDPISTIENEIKAVRECIGRIRECAKADLQLR